MHKNSQRYLERDTRCMLIRQGPVPFEGKEFEGTEQKGGHQTQQCGNSRERESIAMMETSAVIRVIISTLSTAGNKIYSRGCHLPFVRMTSKVPSMPQASAQSCTCISMCMYA